jgi:hypothetical protein
MIVVTHIKKFNLKISRSNIGQNPLKVTLPAHSDLCTLYVLVLKNPAIPPIPSVHFLLYTVVKIIAFLFVYIFLSFLSAQNKNYPASVIYVLFSSQASC